jgi:hypothetical protein
LGLGIRVRGLLGFSDQNVLGVFYVPVSPVLGPATASAPEHHRLIVPDLYVYRAKKIKIKTNTGAS